MFTESLSDPTTGQRSQLSRLHPEAPQPVTDPTAGQSALHKRDEPGVPQPILDPTDPRIGTEGIPGRLS
jgi:hypothetical protein